MASCGNGSANDRVYLSRGLGSYVSPAYADSGASGRDHRNRPATDVAAAHRQHTAVGPDPQSLPMPYFDQPLSAYPPAQGRCERAECIESRRKLKEAMQANRAWERRYNELHRESLNYTQDLERQLRQWRTRNNDDDDRHPDKPRPPRNDDQSRAVRELQRQLQEERQRSSVMRQRVEFLDSELRLSRADLQSTMERAASEREEFDLMRQQVQAYQEDFESERSDRERLQAEKETIREQLVLAQQQASTHQANFLAARREKEELLHRLRSLTTPQFGNTYYRQYSNEPAGCEINGYGYDEPG